MDLLIRHPWLALVPALVLFGLWWRSRSRWALAGAVLWLAYLCWEYVVQAGSEEADIRVDLLLLYPILVAVTLAGLWFGRNRSRR